MIKTWIAVLVLIAAQAQGQVTTTMPTAFLTGGVHTAIEKRPDREAWEAAKKEAMVEYEQWRDRIYSKPVVWNSNQWYKQREREREERRDFLNNLLAWLSVLPMVVLLIFIARILYRKEER